MNFTVAVLIWLTIVAVFILIEMITLGLTTVWFAGGALVAAIASAFGAPIWIQLLLFIFVSILLFVFTRPIAMKHLNPKTEKTNVESLIGKKAVVLQTIHNQASQGQVKVNDIEWTARSTNDDTIIQAGTTVIIRKISGVKLIVEAEKET